eukprot:343358-Heterocapsa_arctica.AAC.1
MEPHRSKGAGMGSLSGKSNLTTSGIGPPSNLATSTGHAMPTDPLKRNSPMCHAAESSRLQMNSCLASHMTLRPLRTSRTSKSCERCSSLRMPRSPASLPISLGVTV